MPATSTITRTARGLAAEGYACAALAAEGWQILGRRLRTEAGEIDAVATKDGVVAFVEVKARPTLAMAARALGPRQQGRLLGAAEILLARNPSWALGGIRFDLLVVDPSNRVRRIADTLRLN